MSQIIRTDVNGLIEYLENTGLKLSQSMVYSLVRKNEIPYKKVGGKIIFDIATVERWLEPEEKENAK